MYVCVCIPTEHMSEYASEINRLWSDVANIRLIVKQWKNQGRMQKHFGI